jgi:hypothetical protein
MNDRDLKTGVVPIKAAQLPATKKPPNWWKRFRTAWTLADSIVDEYRKLTTLRREFYARKPGDPLPAIGDAMLSDVTNADLARCRELLADIDREDNYEEDEDGDRVLKKPVIMKRLAMMLSAGVGQPKNPDMFSEVLIAHVFDAEVSYPALESACRAIEDRQKFMAVTAEVIEEIKTHEDQWQARREAIDNIESVSQKLQNGIRAALPKYELERAKATAEKAEREFHGQLYCLGRDEKELVAKQDAARLAYLNVEKALAALADTKQRLDAARNTMLAANEAMEGVQRKAEGA